MSGTDNQSPKDSIENLAKRAEESIGEFEAHLMSTLPPGLNSSLSRHERAMLKTYLMWALAQQPERSTLLR